MMVLANVQSMISKLYWFQGILNGISSILLTFDESEVRKLVDTCRQVYDHLFMNVEAIENMDDLVAYIKVSFEFGLAMAAKNY
jgi:hypothetical protein